ncbi:hypothetical protein EU527_07530 [Candidatus Thorarchaeota archaeon]|nr:MAG: hypothetical protein EU527_07530 [Candidatus Thorarchaeota archaeon]
MKKIDEIMPELGLLPALVITTVFGIVFELTGDWRTMFIAGALGALFVRRIRKAFLVGFLGVGIAWSILFVYLVVTAQALNVANFFIALLGLDGLGALVIIISVLIGALLGGFGAVLGRAIYEFVDELIVTYSKDDQKDSTLDPAQSTNEK